MRIREVYLDGFGIFHDRRIVIARGSRTARGNQGVVLFTGANESGKTTLMSFIRGVLFGFEGEASRSFYAPEQGGRHGGSLEVEMVDGRFDRIVRYAERGHSRQPASAVGNMSKALYTNVFAFGLAELAVLSSLGSDEVRSRIYSAGAGRAQIVARGPQEAGVEVRLALQAERPHAVDKCGPFRSCRAGQADC